MSMIPRDEDTRGLFVVFEGPDGSGKSTLAKAFTEKLREIAGDEASTMLQPFPSKDGEVGKLIRKTFTGEIKLSEEVIGQLMVADGLDVCERLYDHIQARQTVVCDRLPIVSGWAYQTEVWSLDELLAIQQRMRFMEPDIVFILDVPAEVAAKRMQTRAGDVNVVFEKDDMEYRERLRRRYRGYAMLNMHAVLLDGELPTDQLVETCIDIIRQNYADQFNDIPSARVVS